MSVISLEFFIFFLIVFIIYYFLPGSLQWIWLLFASMYFYIKNASTLQCVVFFIFIAVNYITSYLLSAAEEKTGSFSGFISRHNSALFRTVLIFDVAFLMLLKYTEFFMNITNFLLSFINTEINTDIFNLLLSLSDRLCPPRISYFSLIVIGYLTDVYWGRIKALSNPFQFALFTAYFPQMTSGPIVTCEQLRGDLFEKKHTFSYDRTIKALMRILYGIFKKLVISERLAVIVNTIYDSYEIYPGFYILIAAAGFAFQLYTDFSGLMDIVLGFSELLDITLPENFNTPFYSTTLAEFWRRWHITLGGFLKSYVFYAVQQSEPFRRFRKFCKKKLGKGYEKKYNFPQYLGLLISWFLIGLWHGGGFNYIFGVGIYMGIVIIISELCQPLFKIIIVKLHINTEAFSYTLFKRIRTFLLFIFGLSFFRAENLTKGFSMWKQAFSCFNPWIFFDKSIYSLGIEMSEFYIMIWGLLIVLVVSMLHNRGSVREWLMKQNFLFRLVLFIVLFIMIICYGYYGSEFNAADFIYGKF